MKEIGIWTVQIAQWRKVDRDTISFFDITVKSGDRSFAPTWNLLKGYKDGAVSEDEYTRVYLELMRERISANKDHFVNTLLSLTEDKQSIALACYCPQGKFCHRHLLSEVIFPEFSDLLQISFKHHGEIK